MRHERHAQQQAAGDEDAFAPGPNWGGGIMLAKPWQFLCRIFKRRLSIERIYATPLQILKNKKHLRVDIDKMTLLELLELGSLGAEPWFGIKASRSELRRLTKQKGLKFANSDGTFNARLGDVTEAHLLAPIDAAPDEFCAPFGLFGFSIQVMRGKHYGTPSFSAFFLPVKFNQSEFDCYVL